MSGESPYFTAQFKKTVDRMSDDSVDIVFNIPRQKWGAFIRTVGNPATHSPPERGEEIAIARAPNENSEAS